MVAFLAACQPKVVEKIVEKEVTKIVKEVVQETVIVEGTPQVVEREVTRVVKEVVEVEKVVTPTPRLIAPAKKVKLVYWTILGNVDGIIMDAMVKQFEEGHPNIEVESFQGVPEFETKLQTSVLAGTGPDFVLYRLHYIAPYADKGIVMPLDPGELSDLGIEKGIYDSRVWDAMHYQGEPYAVPLDIHLFALFRNRRIFEEGGLDPDIPPATLEEWYEMAKALNKGGVIGTAIYGWPPGMFWIWYGLMKQWGGELFLDEGTRVDLTTPAHIEPMEWWHRLRWDINPGAMNGDLIRTGQVGLWLDGPWTLSLWSDPERSKIVGEYDISLLPQHDPRKPAVWANSHLFSLPRPAQPDVDKHVAALALMRWVSEHALQWSAEAGQVPASKVVQDSYAWRQGGGPILEGSRKFAEALPYTVFFPQHPKMLEVGDRIAAALDSAVNTEEGSPEGAMAKATEEVNQILAG